MSDRKAAKERNYQLIQDMKALESAEKAKETVARMRKRSEGGHSVHEE